jgi:hypothetical protein
VDYTIARSALAAPSRVCVAARIGGVLPSLGLFTGVRGRGVLPSSYKALSLALVLYG